MTVPEHVEVRADRAHQGLALGARRRGTCQAALNALRDAAQEGRNVMEPSIACAKAGVTTGEWGETLREIFGEYRAPTGVDAAWRGPSELTDDPRGWSTALAERLGAAPKFLVGKPGLDGHSNGAEQIAVRAADVGFAVTYDGIRLTPDEIVAAAREAGVACGGPVASCRARMCRWCAM